MKKLFNLCLVLLFSISLGFAASDIEPDTHKENIEVVSINELESNIVADYSIKADANPSLSYYLTTIVRLSEIETSSTDNYRLEESFESTNRHDLLNWARYWHSIHNTNSHFVKSSGDETPPTNLFLFHSNSASINLSNLSTHLGIGLVEKASSPHGGPPFFLLNPNYFRHFPLC